MKILEEFWYGNIEPTDYDTSSCKEYKKLQELICRNEEKLRAAMTDEQRTALRGLLSSHLGERFYSSILAREKKK